MDEEESAQEEGAKPGKSRKLLLGALVVGVALLGGGGWLAYQKFWAIKAHVIDVDAEEHHDGGRKEVRFPGPLAGVPAGIEGGSPPVASIVRDGVSIDQLAVVVMESGERNIQARLFNQGGQTLATARVDIEFLNAAGAVQLVRAVNPLVVSGGIFGDRAEPLVVGGSRYFVVSTDDPPPGWGGKFAARIREVRFDGGVAQKEVTR